MPTFDNRLRKLDKALPRPTAPPPWPEFDALSEALQDIMCMCFNAVSVHARLTGLDVDRTLCDVLDRLIALAKVDTAAAWAEARRLVDAADAALNAKPWPPARG
jgi:hypothetical protein